MRVALLPRVHTLCLATTSAGVRAHSLLLLARAVARMEREEADKILQTVAQVRVCAGVKCVKAWTGVNVPG